MRHNLEKYQEVILEYMDKVKKYLPKQFPTFKDFLKKMIELVNCEKVPKLGKHMVVFRLTINMRQTKLTKIALSSLFKLVSLGFIDGRVIDTSQEFYTQEFAELFTETNHNQNERRTIMDVLIDSVNSCLFDTDEIIVQSLKLLVAFVLNPYCNITPQNLTKIIKTIIYSFTRSRTQSIDRIAKNMLYQIINYTFQAVEGEVFTIQKNRRKMSIREDSVQKLTSLVMLQLVDMVSLNQKGLHIINSPQILNEKQQPAGLFGYCIICRKTANFYCKDYKVSICSYFCKKIHYEYTEQAQATFTGAVNQSEENLESALQLYESLCNLLSNKSQIQLQPKNQQIILECLLHILETPDFVLSKNTKFIKVTRDKLCNQLLKYCLDIEKMLFQHSFRIFQRIVFLMRKKLKHEISIFINQIYLNILLSVNSTILHKITAIDSLCTILEKPKITLEFYINYDCQTKHECIVQKIVNTLHEIIVEQIYQKPEYQVQIQQENTLKLSAIKAAFYIIDGLNRVFEKYITPVIEELGSPGFEDQNVQDNNTIININPIEIQRQLKQEIMKGTQIFKKNPEKGMKYFLDAQIILNDPKEIAKFFKENQILIGKDAIGQFLGGHQTLNIKVLSDFTDMYNFKDLTVEQALRYYLDQFTLPGEAMQVDRVVQKFSDRYFKENPQSIFKSSGSIYTYCYLLVMLQTDLHNPSVIDKMKLTDFQKLAREINEGEDLPNDYLTQTYNSILKKPLAMRETEKSRIIKQTSINQRAGNKIVLFQTEKEYLIQQGNKLIQSKSDHENFYQKINYDMAYLIKPLLESPQIGQQLFNMFLNYFERDQSEQSSNQCILGLVLFIKLCSFFQIQLQDYINALIKATKLNKLTQIQFKHTSLIKSILQTVPLIGNGLRENGWKSIISMISRLDEMRIIKQTKDTGDVQIIGVLPDMVLDSDLVDKIFVQTKYLDDEAIQEVINALCEISKQEVYQVSPRLYCLQKLVEVSDYNMKRVNFEWTKMWNKVRDHINEVAIKEKQVAIFTVDSLKQLSVKFLQKEELYDLHFQKEVLKPFETIFIQTDLEVKEFILSCINQIVQNQKQHIRSGWKIIFSIIQLGLKENNERISQISLNILHQIIKNNLDLLKDVFTDLIQCLKILAAKNFESMSLAAIDFTNDCFDYLSKQASIKRKTSWDGQDEAEATVRNESTAIQLEQFWIPLLGTLSTLAGDKRQNVQKKSMETLFQLLQQFGFAFSVEFWKMVFNSVLRPIFDEIQFTFQLSLNNENVTWFKESCKKVFSEIVILMKIYFGKLRPLFPEFLRLFENCIQNWNVKFSKYVIEQFKQMVIKIGDLFNEEEWDEIISCIDRMIKSTTPNKLVSYASSSLSTSRMKNMQEECFSQSKAQLLIINITISILNSFNTKLSLKQFLVLQETFKYSFKFAQSFNQQIEQRFIIWKQGVMQELNYLPGLLKQERDAYGCQIIIQKYIYDRFQKLQINLLFDPIEEFITKNQIFRQNKVNTKINDENNIQIEILRQQETERESQIYRQLLDLYILPTLMHLKDEELQQNNKYLFKLLLTSLSYAADVIVCQECVKCKKCKLAEQSNLDEKIQKLLLRLYELK